MKLIRRLLFIFAISMMFGMAITPSKTFVIETKAETLNKTIYVDLSLNSKFIEDGANPYISINSNKVDLALENNNIYKTNTDIDINSDFKVCCYEGSYQSTVITSSLLTRGSYNYLCLSAYIEGSDSDIKGYGYYGAKEDNPGATYKTQRVWLSNDNEYFYAKDEWGTACKNAVGYFANEKWHMIYMSSIINAYDGKLYYYADIPYELNYVHFMRVASSDNHNYLIYQNKKIEQLSYGICYFAGISTYEDFMNITAINAPNADASLLSLVVEAYLTYGKADSNGSVKNTMKNVFTTWFANKSATSNDLKNAKILDYSGYNQQTGSYEGYEKNATYSVNEKWNTMCSIAGIDPNTGGDRGMDWSWVNTQEFKAAMIIAGTAVVVIAGLVVAVVIKKKRTKQED